MISSLCMGVILGLSAGFAPGPLMALVLSETLSGGVKAGVKAALAPLVTDAPIVLVSYFCLSQLTDFKHILAIISVIGGVVVFKMGLENLKTTGFQSASAEARPDSLKKGILVNALSPHPYIFWLSVGGPILVSSMEKNIVSSLLFLCGFYFLLIGAKVFLAYVAGKSKGFLSNGLYVKTMKVLGLALCLFAVLLFKDALRLFGLVGL